MSIKEVFKTKNGTILNGDNLEVLKTFEDNCFHNCISDFPYDLAFMRKKWDTYSNFYDWCKPRAAELLRILKPGGYALIFGHHKTNHRMKCAFEDVGFNIVEEINWIYSSGFPKNQDIGKQISKKYKDDTELSNQWSGWKTSGLKPAKEIITVFQKPLDGTYVENIMKYGCGAMNIDACRVEYKNEKDLQLTKAKCNFSGKAKSIGFGLNDSVYGAGNTPLEQARDCIKAEGRFPSNVILDSEISKIMDKQGAFSEAKDNMGASRFFLQIDEMDAPFLYCPKPSRKEKGEYCSHITVKPKVLIKYLLKLITPITMLNGEPIRTIDITSGTSTHGLCCEELIKEEGYNIEWVNIEFLNTVDEPYFNMAKERLKEYKK